MAASWSDPMGSPNTGSRRDDRATDGELPFDRPPQFCRQGAQLVGAEIAGDVGTDETGSLTVALQPIFVTLRDQSRLVCHDVAERQ